MYDMIFNARIWPQFPATLFGSLPSTVLLFILFVVSIALIFAGRQMIKALVFIAVGIVGAEVGASLAATYLGREWLFSGGLLGFIVGGLLTLFLLPFAVGLGLGFLAYSIAEQVFAIQLLALALGLVFFFVGISMTGRILSLISAVLGGLILIDLSLALGLSGPLATFAIIVVSGAGFWVQNQQISHGKDYQVSERK